MANDSEKTKKPRAGLFSLAIVAVVSAFVCLLTALGIFERFEHRFYDILLGFKKTPVEREEILLVDIDDLALDQMGDWPWTRDKLADVLLYMRELGATTAVFDIEYLSPSQDSVDLSLYERILQNPEANAGEIRNLFIDNDDYFARAIQFFGNTWLTVNAGNLAIDYSVEELAYAEKRFLYQVEDDGNSLEKKGSAKDYSEFSPALYEFMTHANGAGFTNVRIDSDGTRRRIPLLIKYADGVLAQLSLAPLLSMLRPEEIKITEHSIILENVSLDGETKTIEIPIDSDGTMLINWLKKPFASTKIVTYDDGTSEETIDDENTSFKHCSMLYLWNLGQLEQSFVASLTYFENAFGAANVDVPTDATSQGDVPTNAAGADVSADLTTRQSVEGDSRVEHGNDITAIVSEIRSLRADYADIAAYKNYILSGMNGFDADGNAIGGGIDDATFAEYFSLRQRYFENLAYFVTSMDFAEAVNATPETGAEAENFYSNVEAFLFYYNEMQIMFGGKFCIIGNTGSGTTDIGSTPFHSSYPNVGTHANVYNTIMTQDFITPVAWWWAALAAALLSILAFGFQSNHSVFVQSVCGVGLLAVVIFVPVLLIRFVGLYIPITSPLLISVLSYVLVTVAQFRSSEKDKKFITGAFSQCLSKDVVDEIIKDPSKLVLGGKNYDMTAMFTDIQKFSGFSELLTADELVELLNYYLTRMSDIIIDEHGTVDKYEGDAIVAFVGAPVPMEDHAKRACAAALKMKKAEVEINKEIEDIVASGQKLESMPDNLFSAFNVMVKNKRVIFTRIGMNSGEIVAGFMGSENKKNYTVMGNNVNLASRLEGVNKQYSTGGILISDATRKGLDDSFVVRSLDRVQVVNVKTPIRLYELLAFKDEADENLLTYVERWESTMRLFEAGDYEQSLAQFKALLAEKPSDNVCAYYISLLETFFIKGTYPTPRDDFGVAYNAENPADMDESWIGTEKEIKGTFTLLQK